MKQSFFQNTISTPFKNGMKLIPIFMFLTMFIACTSDTNKESETKIHQDIMAVHDDIMPKMGELNHLKREIAAYKDVVPMDNAELKDSLINGILMLSKMEDNMNDWMGNYKYPNPDITHDEMLKYLTGQKDSIKLLSNDIYMSIAVANGLLKNAPPK